MTPNFELGFIIYGFSLAVFRCEFLTGEREKT